MLAVARIGALAVCFAFTTVATVSWVGSAKERVAEEDAGISRQIAGRGWPTQPAPPWTPPFRRGLARRPEVAYFG